MNKKLKIAGLVLTIGLIGCDPYASWPDYLIDIYPAVYNLAEMNTQYDDYNSAPPPQSKYPRSQVNDLVFVYSTNSGTEGKNFDIWRGRLRFEQKSRLKGQTNPALAIKTERIASFLPNETNSAANEFGPYFFFIPKPQDIFVSPPPSDHNTFSTMGFNLKADTSLPFTETLSKKSDTDLIGDNLYFFSSDRKKKLDIYYYNPKTGLKEFFGNKEDSNESYISYDYKRNVLYFASDRDGGKYHIYKYENKTRSFDFEKLFANPELAKDIVKADEFNSVGNDTCPVVVGDRMIFASDRPGTRGGYDIYSSVYYEGEGWIKPYNVQDSIDRFYESNDKFNKIPREDLQNLNVKINTEADEFRPFIIGDEFYGQYSDIRNPMDNRSLIIDDMVPIIFSSNRKGGKGGFDLHLGIFPWAIP
jgi:hypothetical protein